MNCYLFSLIRFYEYGRQWNTRSKHDCERAGRRRSNIYKAIYSHYTKYNILNLQISNNLSTSLTKMLKIKKRNLSGLNMILLITAVDLKCCTEMQQRSNVWSIWWLIPADQLWYTYQHICRLKHPAHLAELLF